jgi:hypothetical protein
MKREELSWRNITIENWGHFTKLCTEIPASQPILRAFCFRGQSDPIWTLKPSILRLWDEDTWPPAKVALQIEATMIEQFRFQVGKRIESLCNPDEHSIRGLMQHYRAPTRLLDWTLSPYVAAYFAVENHWDRDGVIWYLDYVEYRNISRPSFADQLEHLEKTSPGWQEDEASPGYPVYLHTYSDDYGHDRIVAQQGLFTACLYILTDHAEVIDKELKGLTNITIHSSLKFHPIYGTLTIPAALKREFLRNLLYMNISASSLFPGMDGIGRAMNELGRLRVTASHRPKPFSDELKFEESLAASVAHPSEQPSSGTPSSPDSPPGEA